MTHEQFMTDIAKWQEQMASRAQGIAREFCGGATPVVHALPHPKTGRGSDGAEARVLGAVPHGQQRTGAQIMKATGCATSTLGNALTALVRSGQMRRVRPGLYERA